MAEPVRPTAPLAMWALTGTLPGDEVRRQLDLYAGAGWGVVLYPRWGLELEYLGTEWFERIRDIVEQAAVRQLEVWLYDEFCWPSGQARGQVAAGGDEYCAQVLRVAEDGRNEVATLPNTASLLDRAATERFMTLTHRRYADAVGDYFGTTIRAVFTDEPSLPQMHGGSVAAGWRYAVPWSDALDAALDRDFPRRLTAVADPADPQLWHPYWAAYTAVFGSAWVRPLSEWCEANGLRFSGHLLGEGSYGGQVAYNGSVHHQLQLFGLPGIDEIATRCEVENCEALTLAEISRFPGAERMCEVYALGPPSLSWTTMTRMVDLLAACGVDRYVLAICPFDFKGALFKRAYFGIHSWQQPWFAEHAAAYAEYLAGAAETARQAPALPLEFPDDDELWALAGPDPRQSPGLKAWTEKTVKAAREALRERLTPHPPAVPAESTPVEVQWAFGTLGPNSLRVEAGESTLRLAFVPEDLALSVHEALVSEVRVNGELLDLSQAEPDLSYDGSYLRVPLAELVEVGDNTLVIDSTEAEPLEFMPHAILWGDYAVAEHGILVPSPDHLPLGDWRELGYPQFCGTGCYFATFAVDGPTTLCCDTGGYSAVVRVNGVVVSNSADPRVELAGESDVTVRISSTLGHLVDAGKAGAVGLLRVVREG